MLDAAADQYADAAAARARDQHLDEGGLADAGLAGDEDELARAAGGHLQPALHRGERRPASHAPIRGEAKARRRSASPALVRFGVVDLALAATICPADQRDEPIAAARHRLDEARRAGIVAEREADRIDRHAEARFGDVKARPYRREKRLLGDEFAGVFGEMAEHAERLRRKRDPGRAAPELGVGAVKHEVAEDEPAVFSLHLIPWMRARSPAGDARSTPILRKN